MRGSKGPPKIIKKLLKITNKKKIQFEICFHSINICSVITLRVK